MIAIALFKAKAIAFLKFNQQEDGDRVLYIKHLCLENNRSL
jgi:hypothetical protein